MTRYCDGACETEAGCHCWAGVQVVGRRKVTEADLDQNNAEKWPVLPTEAATEIGADELPEWRDNVWLTAAIAAGLVALGAVVVAII